MAKKQRPRIKWVKVEQSTGKITSESKEFKHLNVETRIKIVKREILEIDPLAFSIKVSITEILVMGEWRTVSEQEFILFKEIFGDSLNYRIVEQIINK